MWNSLHKKREYASWEGLLPGSSSLVAKCIPVFIKVRRCIYSYGYPHTTTINLSSIVVSDFLPPLVMTSLLEQAPDWLTRCEYPPKFRFFNSREWCAKCSIRAASFARIAPHDCLSRLCIDLTCKSFARNASFASGVNAPLETAPVLKWGFQICNECLFISTIKHVKDCFTEFYKWKKHFWF